jgi:ubiquinone/menaquinone biosynthesis C-methylase UbiE
MLDAGCGTGEKAMAVARQNPDLQVVALDMVDSISISAQRAIEIPNLHFVQGDVMHPPFKTKSFAKMLSWGVLHHTPNTEEAFRVVSRLLSPGGRLLVWLFPHPSEDRLLAKYHRIRGHFLGLGHRLPPRLLLWLARIYCLIMSPVLLHRYKHEILPRLQSRDYFASAESLSGYERYKCSVFMVFDILVAERFTTQRRADVVGWYDDNGFTNVETDNLGHYWGELRDPPPGVPGTPADSIEGSSEHPS